MGKLHLTSNPPLSLYIHLPWCIKKCPYCDFNSHAVTKEGMPETSYISALISDLESALPSICDRPISSIFIGGGTPSLFSVDAINRLMTTLHSMLVLYNPIEITIEVNPGNIDIKLFKSYLKAGINRISIGVQSFDNKKLSQLGRIHDRNHALDTITIAKDAGFDEINIDLMFGLPEQTIDQAISDLQIATKQDISHISWYQLTIEPNTIFYKTKPKLPNDDLIFEIYQQGKAYLYNLGFKQYEISAYAKEDATSISHQCQHNLNYWQFADYLGIGAGAHSKLTNIKEKQIKRYARHRTPHQYVNNVTRAETLTSCQIVATTELPLEFMMNALRLRQGFHPLMFTERTGVPLSQIQPVLQTAEQQHFIEWSVNKIKPTELGYRYLNNVLQLFMI